MPRVGYTTITVRQEVYDKILKAYKERVKSSISFSAWLSDYILEHLEEDELLSRYAPGLELIGVEYDTAFVKDWFIDRIVEVVIRDQGVGKRFLYCRHCERDDCLHVGFCFAVREINKVLVERGFKQPKVRKDG
jgi:predicted CopG family antitoxin